MLFQHRLDRARDWQRRQRGLDKEPEELEGEDLRETPALHEEMEKGDLPAMLLAGFLTVFLPAVAVLGLVVGVACLLFGLH